MFSALVLDRLWVKGIAISGGGGGGGGDMSSSSSICATAAHMKTHFLLHWEKLYGSLPPNASIYVDRLAESIN
jgi:hypothetical protein